MLGKMARYLIWLVERYADPVDREWIAAMRAEFGVIDGGLAQLRWAAGAVRVLWRPYRVDLLRFMLCVAAVVVANYTYPKFATARPVELFFFAQQLYLPVVGILAANSTRRVLVGTVHGADAGCTARGFRAAVRAAWPAYVFIAAVTVNAAPGLIALLVLTS